MASLGTGWARRISKEHAPSGIQLQCGWTGTRLSAGPSPTHCLTLSSGLIIVNAWYGKFVNDKSRKSEKAKVIDVTVPLQCLVKDSKLILTEASKV